MDNKITMEEKNEIHLPVMERAHYHNKIILLLMIKNESKIIERCIENALQWVDAVSVLDTGSTDNTVEICNRVLLNSKKPYKITTEEFKNFGYNRTVSFNRAQEFCKELEWNMDETYTLAVDADMIIKPTERFRDYKLVDNGYTVIQDNGSVKYYNNRLMKCGYSWKCVGATHEYWSGDPTSKIPYVVFHIDDKNDGGCKSDKFERDVRLLREELKENPKNDRAHYYLGQSLKDLGNFDEAIQMFEKRIELGGWYEEVWYAMLQIGRCYGHKKDEHQMELWMNKAFNYHPKRSEPLYHLTRHFRENSQHYKAYHYYLKGRSIPYPKDDVLFIEKNIYDGLFEYERTILDCYVTNKSKQDSLCDLIYYINNKIPFHIDNVWDNLHYYVEPLTSKTYHGEYSRLLIPDSDEYKSCQCSIQPFSDDPNKRYIMNIRYVNYSIDSKGCYHMRSSDNHVKTRNGRLFLNSSYQPTEDVRIMNDDYQKHPSSIEGLEDVRLFYYKNSLKCTASSKNFTNTDKIVLVYGDYDIHNNCMANLQLIEPPRPTQCEKNWVFVDHSYLTKVENYENNKNDMNFIYGWGPLEIGSVKNNKLEIHTTYSTPSIFNRFRGSSNLVAYNGYLWCVVHFVKYSQPRVYYHSVVKFEYGTMKPLGFTAPFAFCETKIEYSLGFNIVDNKAVFFFSRNDTDTSIIKADLDKLKMILI